MKLLVFTAYFYPHRDGVSFYNLDLFSRYVKTGGGVSVVTSKKGPLFQEEYKGIRIYRIPCWDILGGTYPLPKPSLTFLKLINELGKQKFDAVITNTRFFVFSLLGCLFAKVKKVKLIHIEHGTSHPVTGSSLNDMLGRIYDHTLGSLILKNAYKVAGVSHACGRFVEHLGKKLDQVVPVGVDIRLFSKVSTDLRSRLGIGREALVLVFVGRLVYAKGVQDLIKAFLSLEWEFNNLKLLIVGEGNYQQDLQRMSNGESGIYFLGNKSREEVVEILSIADIFVNPSYSEGLPASVLEAGAVGLPVIATLVGGTSEIIEEGVSGVLYRSGDIEVLENWLKELIRDKNLRDTFSQNIKRKVTRDYNWDKNMGDFLHFLKC